ncbi:flagellar hook-basal body protein [Alkalihalobacillus alcalophilus ATCC 27647 = CGMCC 1.3604]|uniref:Flagellar basal body rod protein FlgG n=1 Tax=Alkalihalobacillus alcalophilus ATCC 27647 = CGMCC 1.3604 TaxID=1218173 RepID=A0A094WH14_ALKAL|nr:flagellar hook-basal body protein [Alkalihalobacillus alcalophilus]KGA97069.1 flagellar basal body rod protein FlgG [Alkalihalobacillus alcalophilus ATCC 27647 = CGMCC 1.3604]MED1561094.1 flagellar hook-basal body protein [Alkalihalobacillus alcalophilus]THG90162.1 flagellar hook-basal body protein [Alkalihalobacillus alcalophilus ATCC 27647 = CGMCC 1.3604]
MNRSMITASVTMGQIQSQLDTISHNLTNSQTVGFKRREASFHDLLSQQLTNQSQENLEVGRLTPMGLTIGAGAKIGQTALRLEQGALQTTDRELDFALTKPNHFFRVEAADGTAERMTRAGNFYLTANAANPEQLTLVTASGDFLLDNQGERIIIPEDFSSFQLHNNGQLLVTLADGSVEEVANLGIRQVHNAQLLVPVGENQFELADLATLGYAEADVIEDVNANEIALMQKTLEGSNVDMAKEMSDLMIAQRHYQFNSTAISMADQMSGLVNGIRG